METTCPETVNQYLRFGWKLLNQYRVEATESTPEAVRYVLASVRSLDDTRVLTLLTNLNEVNRYLEVGWRLVERFVTRSEQGGDRQESVQFILAWQIFDPPQYPSDDPASETGFHRSLSTEVKLDLAEDT